jgi:hypothetical protein
MLGHLGRTRREMNSRFAVDLEELIPFYVNHVHSLEFRKPSKTPLLKLLKTFTACVRVSQSLSNALSKMHMPVI